jgi:hypothetical protein
MAMTVIAELLVGGQQAIVRCGWQSKRMQAESAKTGFAESARVRIRATNWANFFMRYVDNLPARADLR